VLPRSPYIYIYIYIHTHPHTRTRIIALTSNRHYSCKVHIECNRILETKDVWSNGGSASSVHSHEPRVLSAVVKGKVMVPAVVGVARLFGNAKQYVCLCNPAQLLRLPGNLLTLARVTQFVCITSVLSFSVAWSAATVMKMGVQQQLKPRKWQFPKFRSSTSPLSLIMTSSSTASSSDFFAWWRVWRMANLLLQTGCWETLPWQPVSHCVRQS